MSAHTLSVASGDSGKLFPLRGDMDVALNITPNDKFSVTFVTYTNEQFVLKSTTAKFRQLDGSLGDTLTFGGKLFLFATMMFNVAAGTWDITANNLSGQATSNAGGGGNSNPSGVNTAEVILQPDANGNILLDGSLGINFSITINQASYKLLNPINFKPGDTIKLMINQDSTGGRLLTYDTGFALPNAQPPLLSTTSNAVDKYVIDVTTTVAGVVYAVTPDIQQFRLVTFLARINQDYYYTLGGAGGIGAFNHVKPGQNIIILRDGLGPEATATFVGTTDMTQDKSQYPRYLLAGAPVNGGQRPTLRLLSDTRPAYGKAVINIEDNQVTEVRDLIIRDARNVDGDARGIAPNVRNSWVTVRNVDIINCMNGMLWGNEDFGGGVDIIDCLFDSNGVGNAQTSGFTHSIYAGFNMASWSALRTSFVNSVSGHNIKTRAFMATLDQVLAQNAHAGRELNVPYGGGVRATNCIFHKLDGAVQNNLVGIGEEGVQTNRVREYTFRNCRFQNDISGVGRDVTFVTSMDPDYPLHFIDCEFIGPVGITNQGDGAGEFSYMTCKNGVRYMPNNPPIFEYTGGPLGPLLPVGKPDNVTMTPLPVDQLT